MHQARRSPRIIAVALPILTLLLGGCFGGGRDRITLWTNRPEFAAYVELYNAEQSDHRLELVYKEHPAEEIRLAEEQPDLVVSGFYRSLRTQEYYRPLGNLLRKKLEGVAFYEDLLALGREEDQQLLLPVSFNLPLLMFRNDLSPRPSDSMHLPLDELKEIARELMEQDGGTGTFMGFSPLWDRNFIYYTSLLHGAAFRREGERDVRWNATALEEALGYLGSWIVDAGGGAANERAFRERYLYDPGYKLVRTGRTGFFLNDAASFFILPEEKRADLDFRWISRGDRIPTEDTIVFAGIPRHSDNPKAAEAFLTWFFAPENQDRMLRTALLKRVRTFGIAGGFSSLIRLNEVYLPRHYHLLVGHIPPGSFLQFPEQLPVSWSDMKRDVILPWMAERVSGAAAGIPPNESTKDLRERLDGWFLTRPKF